MNITAIVQARMGSNRLPNKVLKEVSGRSILSHILARLSHCSKLNNTIVATTNEISDNAIAKFCANEGVSYFRGSENDVLDRFYQCALTNKIDIIVRITGDCPLLEPSLIDLSITTLLKSKVDYVSTAYPEASFPDGLDVEVFTFDSLYKAWKNASLASEREHVTPYIWKSKDALFQVKTIKHGVNLSNKRWTLDDEEDFLFITEVYRKLYKSKSIFYMDDILRLLKEHPEIELLNAGKIRNEGYQKSINEDKRIK